MPNYFYYGYLLIVISLCGIFRKAGFNWLWGLVGLIPGFVVFSLLYLAIKKWPIEKELDQERGIVYKAKGKIIK